MEETTQIKTKKSGNLVAKVFHPVFLFFYLQVFYYLINPSAFYWPAVLVSFIFTILMPIAFIYFITKGDVYLNDRKKRTIPLLATSASFFVFYLVSGFFSLPYFLKLYLLSLAVGLLLLLLINTRFKISLHGSGIGSFISFFLFFMASGTVNSLVSGISSGFVLLVAYLVLRQRLVSKSHSPIEVVSGFLLGITVSLVVLFFGGYMMVSNN